MGFRLAGGSRRVKRHDAGSPPYVPSVAGRSDVRLVPNASHLAETAAGRLLIAFSITSRGGPSSELHNLQRLPAYEPVRGACSRPLGRARGNCRTAWHYRHGHRRSSVRAAWHHLERFGRRRLTKCTTRVMLNIAGRGRRYVRPRGPRCGSPRRPRCGRRRRRAARLRAREPRSVPQPSIPFGVAVGVVDLGEKGEGPVLDVDGRVLGEPDGAVPVALAANRALTAVLDRFTPVLRRAERLRFSSMEGGRRSRGTTS